MTSPNPILSAIRALLKFKGSATIAEIARMAEVKQRRVLDVVNANEPFVRRTAAGKITAVDVRNPLLRQLWESGAYYRREAYGAWSTEGYQLSIHGHPEIDELMREGRWVGGLGDSYQVKIILDTPENRAELERRGLIEWRDEMLDDRLWKEEA